MRALWGVLLLLGCGDPRTPFVGSYSGTGIRTVNGTTEDPVPLTFDVTAPAMSDRISFDNKCRWQAAVLDSTTIQFDPASCAPFHGTSVSGTLTADYTDTYNSGTGTLSGKSLVLTLDGTEVGSNYSDGSPNRTFNFQDKFTLEKQ